MKNKKHSYYKEGIRRMLLLYSIIPVALLTLVCLLIFLGIWRYSTESATVKENKIITNEIEQTVNSYIDLIQMMEKQQTIFDGEVDVDQRVEIFEHIYDVANKLDKKANIYVYDQTITPIIMGTKTIPSYLDGRYASNWGIFRIMKQNPTKIAIKLLKDPGEDDMQLVIGKAMVQNNVINGYAMFVIDSRQFQIEIAKLDSQTVITDENGWVFVTNNFKFLDTLERFDLTVEKARSHIESKEGRFFIASSPILDNHINIYSILPLSNQLLIIKYIVIVLLFVFTMMFLFVFISSKGMAAKKTKDLYVIIDSFEKAKEGDLDTHIVINSKDEFETIADAHNQMLDSLKEQIERNKEMGKLVAFSQTKQLESQFNPHFLFNTLENIRFMCKMEPEIASKMVLNLSILLRYSISNTQEEVTVNEDIAYMENYMSILKFRFNQRFQYTIDISPEIEECIIPKLLLQPMIENSIKYGFVGREHLVVEINGYMEDDKLVMICSDDGAGMEPEVLEEMQQVLRCSTNESSHSGLYNINRRLQLKYGDEYGIQIQSEHEIGTTLKIVLPASYVESSGGSDAKNINS
ncbi:MAG: histidine kinase internal region [Herbinix sp.]|jgi:two-component system sensor histidine kinase YesM|nr:histidine kinase internal region [Herbinix sp.]